MSAITWGNRDIDHDSELPTESHGLLLDKLLKIAKHSFDSVSSTHIFFHRLRPGFTPRGIGDCPDEAYSDFRLHALMDVQRLSEREARLLFKKVAIDSEVGQTDASRRLSSIVQIGLFTTKGFHITIAAEAARRALSVNELCSVHVAEAFPRLNELSMNSATERIRKMIRSAGAQDGGSTSGVQEDKAQWVIRVPRELRARLLIFANEYDVTVPQICSFLLGELVTSQESAVVGTSTGK